MQIEDTVEGARMAKGTSGSVHVKITDGGPSVDADAGVTIIEHGRFDYETVAASQTDQALGATGAAGDLLHKLICVITTSTGTVVQIKDGAGSAITVLPTGLAAPGFYQIELNIVSTSGAWKITTGANVAVLAIGRFTA